MQELNPCPFCGGEIEVKQKAGSYWLSCPKCGYEPIAGFRAMYSLKQYWDIVTENYKQHPEILEKHRRLNNAKDNGK